MPTLWIVFGAYLAITLSLGELAARLKIRSVDDYLLARRSQGRLITAGSLAATAVGGGSTLGAAGVAYYVGVSASWYLLSASIGLVLLGWTLGPALRRLGVYTVPEFIGERYGPRAGLLASTLGVLGLVLFLAAQLFAMGSVLGELAEVGRETGTVVSGIAVVFYTWRGGIFAIHWSDNVQLVWIAVGLVLVAAAGVTAAGGLPGLADPPAVAGFAELDRSWFDPIRRMPTGGGNLFALGNTIVAWVIMSVTWHFAMQSTAQRILSARDPGTARWACFTAALALVPVALLVAASGMAARILHPELEAPIGVEQARALPALLESVLPPVLAGVVLAALVAVIMSTSDSALLGASTILMRDLAPRFRRDRRADASVVRVRAATGLLGMLGLGVALLVPTLIRMLEFVAAVYCVSLFVPLLAGLYWRTANEPGAIAAMLLSGSAGILWRTLGWEAATGIHMLNLALPLAAAGMIVVSLATRGSGRSLR